MLNARLMNDPVQRLARAALSGGAPPAVTAWARTVLRAPSSPYPEPHLLVERDGRVAGEVRHVPHAPLLGPGAPKIYVHRSTSMPSARRPSAVGRTLLAAVLAVSGLGVTVSRAPAQAPGMSSIHLQAFDRAWTIVYERHFDTTFNGVNWPAVRTELRPRAEAASSRAEVRNVIREMLGRLGQSHFALIAEDAVDRDDDDDIPVGEGGDVGMDVRLVDGHVVVTQVEAGGPAWEAGVRAGWVVTAIADDDMDSLIARRRATEGVMPLGARVWGAAHSRLIGSPGTRVAVTARDARDAPVQLSLTRRVQPAEPVRFGNLPTIYARFTARPVETPDGFDVQRVWFNFWMIPLVRQVDSALFASRGAEGIVIDLRGNGGGVGAMVIGVAGHFFPDRALLGTLRTRTATLEMRANPRRTAPGGVPVDIYDGPVAILVDETTGSASEVFAGGMQAAGRARVFGVTTAGAVLPAAAERLPNSDVLYHAFADFTTPDGIMLEGRGVEPDERIHPTRHDLLAGRDPVLDAAVRWLRSARHRP